MCAARRSEVERLVAGPGIFICGGCVEVGLETLDTHRKPNGSSESHAAPSLKCDFCGKSLDDVLYMMTGEQANICDDCLSLCQRILTGEVK
jgi:ATP-dependent protease Clp ATPase subunit